MNEALMIRLIRYCKENKKQDFQLMIEELQPYDIAQLYRDLPTKHHHKFLLLMESKQIANLLQELEPPMQIDIVQKLGVELSSNIMNLMERDDLADFLNELSVDKIEELLFAMKKEAITIDPKSHAVSKRNRWWIDDQSIRMDSQ